MRTCILYRGLYESNVCFRSRPRQRVPLMTGAAGRPKLRVTRSLAGVVPSDRLHPQGSAWEQLLTNAAAHPGGRAYSGGQFVLIGLAGAVLWGAVLISCLRTGETPKQPPPWWYRWLPKTPTGNPTVYKRNVQTAEILGVGLDRVGLLVCSVCLMLWGGNGYRFWSMTGRSLQQSRQLPQRRPFHPL
jgi:hypothetical protein